MTPPSKMEVFKPTLRVCESNLWAPQFLQWILNLLQCLKTAKNHALKHFVVISCFFFVVFSGFRSPMQCVGSLNTIVWSMVTNIKHLIHFTGPNIRLQGSKPQKMSKKHRFFEVLGPKMTPLSKMEVFKTTLMVHESNSWAAQILQWILNLLQCVKTAKNHALKHFQ